MKNKYKRKWIDSMGVYEIEDLNWIKEQIIKRYVGSSNDLGFIDSIKREMFIHIDKSNYKTTGYIFFSIEGSPPKGCAIYQPDHRFIIIVDAWGKSTKYNQTIMSEKIMKEIIK